MDQTNTTFSEQVEHVDYHNDFQKNSTPPTVFTVDQSHETPPPPKKIRIHEKSCISHFTGLSANTTDKTFTF